MVARHQTGDRPQQGEGPDHPPPARLISEQCTMCANKVFGRVLYVCVFYIFYSISNFVETRGSLNLYTYVDCRLDNRISIKSGTDFSLQDLVSGL